MVNKRFQKCLLEKFCNMIDINQFFILSSLPKQVTLATTENLGGDAKKILHSDHVT